MVGIFRDWLAILAFQAFSTFMSGLKNIFDSLRSSGFDQTNDPRYNGRNEKQIHYTSYREICVLRAQNRFLIGATSVRQNNSRQDVSSKKSYRSLQELG